MKHLMIALAMIATSACDDAVATDSPEAVARKADCKQLEANILPISPHFALAVVELSWCADPAATESPRKVECKQLEAHIFQISPQSAPQFAGLSADDAQKLADQMVAKLPTEDIEQCAAAEPQVIACMKAAGDVAAIKACIPH